MALRLVLGRSEENVLYTKPHDCERVSTRPTEQNSLDENAAQFY
jgi:hypothetical protein